MNSSFNGRNNILNALQTCCVVVTTLFVCLFMTLEVKKSNTFNDLLNIVLFANILLGLITNSITIKKVDKIGLVLTLGYFAARFISYRINGIPITYGGSMMIQAFFLIGICRSLYAGNKRLRAMIATFFAFDICAIIMCYFNYFFRPEYVSKLYAEYSPDGFLSKTNVFQNPNTEGLITGAIIIICIAIVLNSNFERKKMLLAVPLALTNLYVLFADTACRAAQLGVICVVLLMAAVSFIKRIDSVRGIISLAVIGCFLLLVPVYSLVYWGDNETYLEDRSPIEQRLDSASAGRYAIWKTAILSQEGHLLFGYGGHKNAVNKRIEYIEEREPESFYYNAVPLHGSLHNGFLTLIVEAGAVGAIAFLLLFLRRAWKITGHFRDGKWHYLLLVYILWCNLFEAKLINSVFFTGLFMMALLLQNEEVIKDER